jgi:hypothetical protein
MRLTVYLMGINNRDRNESRMQNLFIRCETIFFFFFTYIIICEGNCISFLLVWFYFVVSGPNPSAIKDKSDLNSSPNDALLQPESDRAFYENLPFHGMQNPPNKVKSNSSSSIINPPWNAYSQHSSNTFFFSFHSRYSLKYISYLSLPLFSI